MERAAGAQRAHLPFEVCPEPRLHGGVLHIPLGGIPLGAATQQRVRGSVALPVHAVCPPSELLLAPEPLEEEEEKRKEQDAGAQVCAADGAQAGDAAGLVRGWRRFRLRDTGTGA